MRSAIRDCYAELLARQRWDWFVTLTFGPRACNAHGIVHEERGDKAFRLLVSKLNRAIFGVRWYRSLETQIVWARGSELQKSGRLHFHALMAAPQFDLNLCVGRLGVLDWWGDRFGWARVEVPQGQGDVVRYVAKYAAKDGIVDLSPNFGKVRVQALSLGLSACPAGALLKLEPDVTRCAVGRGRTGGA